MDRLKDKVALITGGTGGLGRDVVSVFLREGASVCTTYTNKSYLESLSGLHDEFGEKLMFAKADVTRTRAMDKVVDRINKKFGRIDLLINIVGGFVMAKITETDEALWDNMMNMNLKSAFVCSKSVVAQMINRKYGRIINIGAKPALKGAKNMSAYGASKAGVLNLTQSFIIQLSRNFF